MSTAAYSPNGGTERRLWLGIAMAPTAWAVHSLLGYWIAARTCANTAVTDTALRVILVGLAAVMLLVALSGLALSLQSWYATGGEGSVLEAEGKTRMNFMALFGLVVSAVFATGLLYNVIAPLLLQPCVHTA